MDPRSSFKITKDVFSQGIEEETVLLDMKSEYYFSLNDVATRIWQLIETKKSFSEIEHTLLSEFDVEAATVKTDLNAFLTAALDSGLIELKTTSE